MKLMRVLLAVIILPTLYSCGGVQTIGVNTTASIIYDASAEVETETNWYTLKTALSGNIKFMEGLHYLQPHNEKLLVSLTKGYAGNGFAVHETLFLKDFYKGNEDSKHKKQALYNFDKALKYGLKFLAENGITYADLLESSRESGGIIKLLDGKLDDDKMELEGVFFTAQALGSLINLQKTNLILVAQAPVLKGLFDWVCEKDPQINFGACDLFYGSYEAGRPKMLGGDPQKGKELFLKGIKNNPKNWLLRIGYIQYYLIPMLDEEGFEEQMEFFEEAEELFAEETKWSPVKKEGTELGDKRLRAFQAVSIKRAKLINKVKNEIF